MFKIWKGALGYGGGKLGGAAFFAKFGQQDFETAVCGGDGVMSARWAFLFLLLVLWFD